MHFDRFDICEAYYLALMHTHGGQTSPEYLKLCRLRAYFTPRPTLRVQTLNTNAREIYNAAVIRFLTK